MKTIFLGTGSANGIPDPYCSCSYCKNIKEIGGKNLRKRSTFLLDEKILLDFSPDIRTQILENNIDFSKIKGIILSHTHNDHLDIQELIKIKTPIDIYINSTSKDWLIEQIRNGVKPKYQKDILERIGHLNINEMRYFKPFKVEDLNIIPLKARHTGLYKEESGMNFILSKDDRVRLHASDTGIYSEETFNFLKDFKFDEIVIECTFLDCYKEHPDHLNMKTLKIMLDRFYEIGCIDSKTPIYITHFGHDPKKTHTEIEELIKALDYNIKVAYDGMKI